jgi:hypothetical protein
VASEDAAEQRLAAEIDQRSFEVVRTILTRAARSYRDDDGRPWLQTIPPLMSMLRVGIKEVDDGIWIVSFMRYDLGYIDLEQKTLRASIAPLSANVYGTCDLRVIRRMPRHSTPDIQRLAMLAKLKFGLKQSQFRHSQSRGSHWSVDLEPSIRSKRPRDGDDAVNSAAAVFE